jgi:hypothetical protein
MSSQRQSKYIVGWGQGCWNRPTRHVSRENCAIARFLSNVKYTSLYGIDIDVKCGYCLDIIVSEAVIVEVKSVSKIIPLHVAQMLTYLTLTKLQLGLIINFNVEVLRLGVRRIILG